MAKPTSKTIQVFRSLQQVRDWRHQCYLRKEKVGFVPTMGALHAGHCSLVAQSLKDNDRTVVSIFVNPSQFAPHEDLESYPRTLDSDLEVLESFEDKQIDAVFVPMKSEMFPSGITTDLAKQRGAFVSVLGCSEQLEGVKRPQFFRGVATIITKFLNVVKPTNIYFGQKDAQQCVVIKNLVKDLLFDVIVKIMPTLREPNGLAMSSRNAYLSPEVREKCGFIFKSLEAGKQLYEKESATGRSVSSDVLIQHMKGVMSETDIDFELEYLAISHPDTLDNLDFIRPEVGALISTALTVPKQDSNERARLIDNVLLAPI